MPNDYLTIRGAADELGCHPETVKRRIYSGEITAYTAGTNRKQRLIHRDDVDRMREIRPLVRTQETQAATPRTAS